MSPQSSAAIADEADHSDRLEIVCKSSAENAHDVANALCAATGFAEMVLRKLIPGTEAHRAQNSVIMALEQATAINRKVVAFSPTYCGKPQAVNVHTLLIDHHAQLALYVGRQVNLRVICSREIPEASVDPLLLVRALSNLAINARAALDGLPDPEVTIAVHRMYDAPGLPAMLRIIFSDNGSGMDSDTIEHIMAGRSVSTKPGHSGLGLGVVRQAIENAGGRLEIASTQGDGATFRIYLPIAGTCVAHAIDR